MHQTQLMGATTNVCPTTNQTYSIVAVAGAQSYTWSVPTGASIVSGQGTTSISVLINTSFVSENISVVSNGTCKSSDARTLVIYKVPLTPGVISGVTNNVCNLLGTTYSITAITGITNYNWTVPTGATIVSGQGTTSIVVNYGSTVTVGSVSVTAIGACANSNIRTLKISGCSIAARMTESAGKNNIELSEIYPNPISNEFNFNISSEFDSEINIQIYNISGELVSQKVKEIMSGTTVISENTANLAKGIYYLKISEGTDSYSINKKFIIQ